MTRSRRRPRARLLLAAIAMLALATALVAGSLVSRSPVMVSGAAVVALAAGWCSLRLSWQVLRRERGDHAFERATLARGQRDEVAAIYEQHSGFASTMRHRIEQRDLRIAHLERSAAGWELRAVEAESTSEAFRRQLDDAGEQIAAMEAVMRPVPGEVTPLREVLVPEWARLETEATEALLAWETHAVEVAGRHRQPDMQRHLKRA